MNNSVNVEVLVEKEKDIELKSIGEKFLNNQRLSFDEGVTLFEKAGLPYVGALANYAREKRHGDRTTGKETFGCTLCGVPASRTASTAPTETTTRHPSVKGRINGLNCMSNPGTAGRPTRIVIFNPGTGSTDL